MGVSFGFENTVLSRSIAANVYHTFVRVIDFQAPSEYRHATSGSSMISHLFIPDLDKRPRQELIFPTHLRHLLVLSPSVIDSFLRVVEQESDYFGFGWKKTFAAPRFVT